MLVIHYCFLAFVQNVFAHKYVERIGDGEEVLDSSEVGLLIVSWSRNVRFDLQVQNLLGHLKNERKIARMINYQQVYDVRLDF